MLIALLYLHILRDTLIIDDGHFTPVARQLYAFMEAGLALPLASWIAILISQKRMKESGEQRTSNRAAVISIVFYCLCTALCLTFSGGAFGTIFGIKYGISGSGVPNTFLEYLYYMVCILMFICQIALIVLLFKQFKEGRNVQTDRLTKERKMKNKRITITALCAAQIVFFVLIALLYIGILSDILIINPIGHFTNLTWQLYVFMEAGLILPLASWIVIIISQKRMKESGEQRTNNRAAIISIVFYCLCSALCLTFSGGAFGIMCGMSGVPYSFWEYLYYIACILMFICQIALIVLLFKQFKEGRSELTKRGANELTAHAEV